jgi:hypothetical protein
MTYEEARKFRETANVPLEWEASDLPSLPPLDRIEFTRRVVMVLRALEYPAAWNDELSWGIFQSPRLNQTLSEQLRFTVRPDTFFLILDDEVHYYGTGYRIQFDDPTVGGTIELLGKNYCHLWDRVNRYGIAENARDNVLEKFLAAFRSSNNKSQSIPSDTTPLSECPSVSFFEIAFPHTMHSMTEISNLVHRHINHYFNVFFLSFCISAMLIGLGIGAIGRGKALLWFIPLAIAIPLALGFLITLPFAKKSPHPTLGEIADAVVEHYCEEYLKMCGEEK